MVSKSITYEITAQVRSDLIERYEAYMQERHITDVLATRFFASASFSRSSDGRYRIRYEAFNQEALDKYLSDWAGSLRKHFSDHFPAGIELSRENWTVLQSWQSPKTPPKD
jgi:hypothetical protein